MCVVRSGCLAECCQRLSLCTDADVVKMDVINALDSSTPPPKRRRVRKPPASKETKPPAEEKETVQNKKSATNAPAKNPSPQKSRTTTADSAVTPPAEPQQEQSINGDKDQPAASAVLEQSSNSVHGKGAEGAMSELKKKKKKKKEKEAHADKDKEEEEKNGREISIGQVSSEKLLGENQKAKGGTKPNKNRKDVSTEDQTVIAGDDSVPDEVVPEQKKEKKAKKKKKEKSKQEEDQVNSEQISEKENNCTEQIMSVKKKKKKSKTDVENSEANGKESEIVPVETLMENSNMTDQKGKSNRKRDTSDFEDPSGQISKKKKRKKDKADRDETTPELVNKDKNEVAEVNSHDHNESTLVNDSAPLPPPCPETPLTEKKKSE